MRTFMFFIATVLLMSFCFCSYASAPIDNPDWESDYEETYEDNECICCDCCICENECIYEDEDSASTYENDRDWEGDYDLTMKILSNDWGDKEYWEVDPFSHRAKSMKNWDGSEIIEHIDNNRIERIDYEMGFPLAIYRTKYNQYLISAYEADADNEVFTTEDGVLFSKDKTILYKYPAMKSGWYYQVPSTVKYIDSDAFLCAYYLRELVIPDSVIEIISGWVFQEACVERIHFPSSIISEFDVDDLGYLPYIKEIILPKESPIADAIRRAQKRRYMTFDYQLSYY